MPDHYSATLRATAKNGEIVVTLKGGPLPKPITHSVPTKDRKAWRELAEHFYQEFSIARGETLNVIQEAVDEAKTKERDSRPAEAPVESKPGDTPADSRSAKVLAEESPSRAQPATDLAEAAPWLPFPVETLPPTVQRVVQEIAGATNTDSAIAAAFALGTLAGAIGNSRALQLNESWLVPSILWVGVIATSGSGKSPVLDFLTKPIEDAEAQLAKDNKQRTQEYEEATLQYEAALREWRNNRSGRPPEKPTPPPQPRLLTMDTTLEAVGVLLSQSPRGLLMARDELSEWFDCTRYKNSCTDAAGWNRCFDGLPLFVDRINRERLAIPRASVSVVGGIQPAVLRQFVGNVYVSDGGMLPRMLLLAPPMRPRRWNSGVSKSVQAKWATFVESLLALQMCDGKNGPAPVLLTMSAEAEKVWAEWYNTMGDAIEAANLTHDFKLASFLSKLQGTAARIALVLHLARWADGVDGDASTVSAESMRNALQIAYWWRNELSRVLEYLLTDEMRAAELAVLEWARKRGGLVTVRDLYSHGPRQFRGKPDEAEAVLSKLARLGYGTLETEPASQKGVGQKACSDCWILDTWIRNFTKRPFYEVSYPYPTYPSQKRKVAPITPPTIHPPKVAGRIPGTLDSGTLLWWTSTN